jgi:hypothetical protein
MLTCFSNTPESLWSIKVFIECNCNRATIYFGGMLMEYSPNPQKTGHRRDLATFSWNMSRTLVSYILRTTTLNHILGKFDLTLREGSLGNIPFTSREHFYENLKGTLSTDVGTFVVSWRRPRYRPCHAKLVVHPWSACEEQFEWVKEPLSQRITQSSNGVSLGLHCTYTYGVNMHKSNIGPLNSSLISI